METADMFLENLAKEISELISDIESRGERHGRPAGYTVGYLDALKYVLDILEEEIE